MNKTNKTAARLASLRAYFTSDRRWLSMKPCNIRFQKRTHVRMARRVNKSLCMVEV